MELKKELSPEIMAQIEAKAREFKEQKNHMEAVKDED